MPQPSPNGRCPVSPAPLVPAFPKVPMVHGGSCTGRMESTAGPAGGSNQRLRRYSEGGLHQEGVLLAMFCCFVWKRLTIVYRFSLLLWHMCPTVFSKCTCIYSLVFFFSRCAASCKAKMLGQLLGAPMLATSVARCSSLS